MKFGYRTPNFKKSFKARTTSKIKRTTKKAVNPIYSKNGIGYINNPKKSIYNKIYNKTTLDAFKSFKNETSNLDSIQNNSFNFYSSSKSSKSSNTKNVKIKSLKILEIGCWVILLLVLLLCIIYPLLIILAILIILLEYIIHKRLKKINKKENV